MFILASIILSVCISGSQTLELLAGFVKTGSQTPLTGLDSVGTEESAFLARIFQMLRRLLLLVQASHLRTMVYATLKKFLCIFLLFKTTNCSFKNIWAFISMIPHIFNENF